jgi:hypothetical protein
MSIPGRPLCKKGHSPGGSHDQANRNARNDAGAICGVLQAIVRRSAILRYACPNSPAAAIRNATTAGTSITANPTCNRTLPGTLPNWDNDPVSHPKVQQSDGVCGITNLGQLVGTSRDPRHLSSASLTRWAEVTVA